MSEARNYRRADRDALIHLSGGTCYWPGCDQLVIRLTDGKYKLAVQIAHICAVSLNGPRYDESMVSSGQINSFSNIILLCYYHHTLVDEDENKYSSETLREWKSNRETGRQETLQGLTRLTENTLQELITTAFADQEREIQETLVRLEASDREAADMLRTLVDEITELRMRGSLVDADVVGTLDSAADRLGHLQDTAVWLADAAQKLGHLQDTASWIAEAAQNLSHLQDSAGLIDDAARNLGSNLDSTINRLESLVDELRGLQHGF